MSEIAEIRKLFQDFIAPDLQAVKTEVKNATELASARHNEQRAQIEASEARVQSMLDKADNAAELRFVHMEQRIVQVQGSVDQRNETVKRLVAAMEIEKRLTKIESQTSASQTV